MKYLSTLCLLILLLTGETLHGQSDEQRLRQLRLEYETYWKNGDAEGVMNTLWEDAMLLPHHGDAMVVGKQAIQSFWFPEEAPPTTVPLFESEINEIKIAGDQAYLLGTFRLVFEAEQKRYTNRGNFINIAERRKGKWRLSRLIWNDPQPTVTPMENKDLPYYQIPDYPEVYKASTVAARLIDGLGFRYYWATESLREEDLLYRTGPDARTIRETLDHIHGLVELVLNAVKQQPNIRPSEQTEMTFAEERKATLLMLKEASDSLKISQTDGLEDYQIIFKRGERESVFPFWNVLNGPLADALWHTGQVVAFRRAAGNPIDGRISVFQGKIRE